MSRSGLPALWALPPVLAIACSTSTQTMPGPHFGAPRDGVFQEPVPFVSSTDDELLPSVAIAVGTVAYAAKVGGNLDIYVRDLDGARARRLTTHSTDDTDPAFSPDGGSIAWVSQAEDVKGDIWLMQADGSNSLQLTDRRTVDRSPAWSADGRRVFFGARDPGSLVERIDVIDIGSGDRSTVVEAGWDPAPAPDGRTLIYVASDERSAPRLYARDLTTGRVAAITDGAFVEGLPRVTSVAGKTIVVFVRFVDDLSGDGIADASDPSSLWAVDFTPGVFAGAPTASPRPLTSSAGSEIFAAPAGDWMIYTASGFSDLDLYALPLTGIINSAAGPEVVLAAARGEDRPALRRLALRYLIATAPDMEGEARYELARDLAQRGRFSDAIDEYGRVVGATHDGVLDVVAQIEMQRLEVLDRLGGALLTREEEDRRFVLGHVEAIDRIEAGAPDDPRIHTRAAVTRAEAQLALGERRCAVDAFEDIAAAADVPAEDGARALDRLGGIYGAMGDLDAVERVSAALSHRFAGERSLVRSSAQRWVDLARASEEVSPLAALNDIVATHGDLRAVSAQAVRAQAALQMQLGSEVTALDQWRRIVAEYPRQRAVRAEALVTIAEISASRGAAGDALDAYERILADFPDDTELRARAKRGITRIALAEATEEEAGARGEHDGVKQLARLQDARDTYARLLRNNPELVIAHRRYVALSAQLGRLPAVVAEYRDAARNNPRDKIARYGFAYASMFQRDPPLHAIREELVATLALDPRFAAAHLSLGWVRERLEAKEPGQGWLEKAVDSYDLAVSLVQPSGGRRAGSLNLRILAAANLNKGNALFALGKADVAFNAYLARELSGVPFDTDRAEALFRESFARVALSQGAYDVALDMALGAYTATSRRKAATASLLGALYLQVASASVGRLDPGAYADAVHWYEVARRAYAQRGDWGRVVPMLRGKGLAQRGLGLYSDALATLTELLAILKRGDGPEKPEPPGIGGLIVQEIPSDPRNVTRARYGFDRSQERELARSAASRIFAHWRITTAALEYADRRLELLRSEAGAAQAGGRVGLELLAAIHESAVLYARAGRDGPALALWREAVPLARKLRRWRELGVVLDSVMALHLARRTPWPAGFAGEMRAAASQARAATESEAPELARRLARWLSLDRFRDALAAPRVDSTAAPATRITGLLSHLDRAEREVAEAHELARSGDRAALEASLAAYLGVASDGLTYEHRDEPVAGGESAAPGAADLDAKQLVAPAWRRYFALSLRRRAADATARLGAAIEAFLLDASASSAIERPYFVAAAARGLADANDIEGAWRLLEHDRLLSLQPAPQRVTREPASSEWAALRASRGTTGYGDNLAAASALVGALEGRVATLAAVQGSLEGNSLLVQGFPVGPDETFWFVVGGGGLSLRRAPRGDDPPAALAELLIQAGGRNVETIYWDTGEMIPGPAGDLSLGGSALAQRWEVCEVLSATYLVATFESRNVARNGYEKVRASQDVASGFARELPPYEQPEAKDVTAPVLARILSGRGIVQIADDIRAERDGWGRPGLAQAVFGPLAPARSAQRIDFDTLAAASLDAGALLVSAGSLDARAARGLMQSALLAGVPSTIVCGAADDCDALRERLLMSLLDVRLAAVTKGAAAARLRLLGYRGMDPRGRVEFAVARYGRLKGQAIGHYKRAFKSNEPTQWQRTEQAFEHILDVLAFLEQPDNRAVLVEIAPKVARSLEALELGFRTYYAKAFQAQRKFEAAGRIQALILESYIAGGKKKKTATMLRDLGKTYAAAKLRAKAADSFARCTKAAAALAAFDDTMLASDCWSRMGTVERDLLHYDDAVAAYRHAYEGYQRIGSPKEAYPRRYLGFLYENVLNDYTRALAEFRAAIAAARRNDDVEMKKRDRAKLVALIPQLHIDMSRIYRSRGDYDAALEEVGRASELLVGASPIAAADAVLEAAKIYWYRGNYRRALDRQKESLRLSRLAAADPLLSTAATFLEIQSRSLAGLIALNQGDLEVSEASLRDALLLARQTGRRAEQARQLNNLGVMLLEAGRIAEAIERYRSALTIEEELASKEGQAYALRGLGLALLRQGSLEPALQTVDRSLRQSRELGNGYNELRCLYARGQILAAQDSGTAAASFTATVALARKMRVPELEWRARYALGRLAEDRGDTAAARQTYAAALAVAERLGRGRSEGSVEHSRRDLYADTIRLAVAGGDLDVAFAYTERARARGFLDVLASASLELPDPRAKTLLAAELKTREAMLASQRDLETKDTDEAPPRPARAAHDAAMTELRASYPRLARILTMSPVSLDQLQGVLPAGVLVSGYFIGRESTTQLLITHTSVRAIQIEAGAQRLDRLVVALRRAMEVFNPVDRQLAQLGDLLLGNAAPELAAATTVIFLPDRSLHHVPFMALPLDGAPLVERLGVAQAPAGSALYDQLVQAAPPRPRHVAALAPADDLPFARLEAKAVGDGSVFVGPAATVTALERLESDAVDIAAHGRLNPRDPLASAIELAPEDDADSRLEVREVFGLQRVPRLVTLSACETVSARSDGSEWVGVGYAFLTAGARSVIAATTRVSDLAAAIMMKRFYRVVRTETTVEALRQAALWTRARYGHPAHWASFILMGDYR